MENIADKNIIFKPIGIIRSPFTVPIGMPIQPKAGEGISGRVEIFKAFEKGLQDLEGFSYIVLIYHLHKSKPSKLSVKPFLNEQQHGVFATRSPNRPNAIGFSIVRLREIKGNVLTIENVDILDGTPLLDIKPYIREFDSFDSGSSGWISDKTSQLPGKKSDDRFM